MFDRDVLHIRISREMQTEIDRLVEEGLFSNKNEVIRGAIRCVILKYKDEIKNEDQKLQ